ncbi:MAG: hypothetical protein HYZ50_21015 [Deltaproteobacteria bacterium]|nr:hypothetical protein [Deltaproteobacteria bacterium]
MTLSEILPLIPAYHEFLTLEELHQSSVRLIEEFPHVARSQVIGASTDGRPIELLTIGYGKRTALFLGAPHPNEPIGTLTLEFLSRLLCERADLRDQLDCTFLIVKASDPDGLALNEGWFKGAFSPLKYALNYYRPPQDEQVEWGFPIQYKTLQFTTPPAETRAVMQIMQRSHPDFLFSLHNASFCGVYFYLSRRLTALFPQLHQLVADYGLPLHQGEPEVPYIQPWDQAIYPLFGAQEGYDFLAKNLGEDPAPYLSTGTSSDDYLKKLVPHALSLICELPYYTDLVLEDTTLAGVSRREAMAEGMRRTETTVQILETHFLALQDALPQNRLFRSVSEYLRRTPKRLAAQRKSLEAPDYAQEATRAQAFDARVCRSFHCLLYLGELYRLATAIGEASRAEEMRQHITARMSQIDAESTIQILPLRKLVAIQAGSSLLALSGRTTD